MMKFNTRKGDTVCTCGLKLTEAEIAGLGALGSERLEKLTASAPPCCPKTRWDNPGP